MNLTPNLFLHPHNHSRTQRHSTSLRALKSIPSLHPFSPSKLRLEPPLTWIAAAGFRRVSWLPVFPACNSPTAQLFVIWLLPTFPDLSPATSSLSLKSYILLSYLMACLSLNEPCFCASYCPLHLTNFFGSTRLSSVVLP